MRVREVGYCWGVNVGRNVGDYMRKLVVGGYGCTQEFHSW